MHYNGYPEWEAWQVAKLHEMWPTGAPVTAIAKATGMSVNAVVSKRKREHLPARPSPIKRPVTEVNRGPVTLPPLACLDV